MRTLRIFAIGFGALSASVAYAERVPMEADRPPAFMQQAEPYVIPAPDTAEAALNPYASSIAADTLTYDETTAQYTYWYTRRNGKRLGVTFDLASRILTTIITRVEADSGRTEFTYVYTVKNLAHSPQGQRFVYFQIDPKLVDEILVPEGWRYLTTDYDTRRNILVSYASFKDPRSFADLGLKPGETITFKFKSRYGPRLVNVAAQGYNRRPGFPPGEASDNFALGLGGNSVVGVTVGPGTQPLDAPLEALKDVISTAGVWGWISKAMEKDLLERIDRFPATRKTLRQFLKEIDTTAGRRAPEVHALIKEIESSL